MNTQRWAIIIISVGLLLSVAALCYLPHSPWGAGWQNTGPVGDTIGGIIGPILNFVGLLVLYLSLREQFIANQLQVRELTTQRQEATNEANFNIALLILDKLIVAAKEAQADIEACHQEFASIGGGYDLRPHLRGRLNRQFLNTSYLFTYVATTVEQDQFTPNQLQAISGMLLSFYKPYLDYMQSQYQTLGDTTTPVDQQINLIVNGIRHKADQLKV